MPVLTSDSLTLEAFESRMRLRRGMFARCGVSVAALHAAHDLDAVARRSVETCIGCDADADCAQWLDATGAQNSAPAFCPNRSLIAMLQNDRRLQNDGA